MRKRRMSLLSLKIFLMRTAAPTMKEKIQTREERLRTAKGKLSSALQSLRRRKMKKKRLLGDKRSMIVGLKRSMMQSK